MTTKQKMFYDSYDSSGDVVSAYKSVYRCSDAIAKLRGNELLNRRIETKVELIEESSTNVDSKFIVSNLKDIALNSAKESDRIRALEILAKLTGVFNNNQESELVVKIDY
jgi:hypothetical protein